MFLQPFHPLLPTQPLLTSHQRILVPGAVRVPALCSAAWENPVPSPFFGSQLLKTSLQIPQNLICKKTPKPNPRRSFALIELDLTCCCLYQLLWKENGVERESGAWQTFSSSPYCSSNVDDFLSVLAVCGFARLC